MQHQRCLVITLCCLIAPVAGDAAVFCKKRSGVVVLRDACRRREARVAFDQVTGAQGTKGDAGPAGRDGQNGQDGQDGHDGTPGFNDVQVLDIKQWTNTLNQNLGITALGESTVLTSSFLPPGTWLLLARVRVVNKDNDAGHSASVTCSLRAPSSTTVVESQVSLLTGANRDSTLAFFGHAVITGALGAQIRCSYDGSATLVVAESANIVAVKVKEVNEVLGP